MKKPIKVSFPHMGDYYVPAKFLLTHIFPNVEVCVAPPITSKTIELGSKYSPDFVCTPFKYTLGSMIESLENGVQVLFQAGGGCRYGYYSELQIQILKDLNYQFQYINLVSAGKTDGKKIYKELKKINPKISMIKVLYYAFLTSQMVSYMDKIDDYIRENIGFEKEKDSFVTLKKKMLIDFSKTKNLRHLKKLYKNYFRQFKKLPIEKPNNYYKVGIIGELYTLMEPFANYELEHMLARFGISLKRYTNVTYLLFKKKQEIKQLLKSSKDYIHYKMGADASDNIARCLYLCKHNYDGIIHIKSSFCTPEIGAMPIIQKICNQHQVPVLFFSFDANTSKVGLETRIEAFFDMLEMRKKK